MAGRPKFEITEQVMGKAEELASQGLTLGQIATSLGISHQTMNARRKEYFEFSEAIKRGQVKGIGKITNALFENAMGGNVTAQIFYLKNRAPEEWKDRQHIDKTGETTMHVKFTQIEANGVDDELEDEF